MATAKGDVDHLPIYDLDPKLDKFKGHFSYRIKRFLDQKGSIEENEGSLEEFSKVYASYIQMLIFIAPAYAAKYHLISIIKIIVDFICFSGYFKFGINANEDGLYIMNGHLLCSKF